MTNPSFSFEALSLSDLTQSVDRFVNHISINNVTIPRFNEYSDVFDFITEFELATATLTEEQKMALLVKAFPPGHNRAWFETDLKPLIEAKKPWKDARTKIIGRFSETADSDRHLRRLRELKYEPKEGTRLLDFVEDMLYSHRKAFPDEKNEMVAIRYVKASLPATLNNRLSMITGYKDAKTAEQLKTAVRHFDLSRDDQDKPKSNDHIGPKDLANILQQVLQGIREENTATRDSIVAAIRTNRHDTPSTTHGSDRRYERSVSPRRYGNDRQYDNRRSSPYPGDRRSHSPHPNDRRSSPPRYQDRRSPSPHHKKKQEQKADEKGGTQDQSEAFNTEAYYARFKKPERPCKTCQGPHWDKHCPFNLKE